jgi:putative hemolysin
MRKALICFLTLTLLLSTASALRNPSAVYCEAMGYDYVIFSSPYGDVGKCVLPNGEAVNAWDFYRGEVALDYSYCASRATRRNMLKERTARAASFVFYQTEGRWRLLISWA